MKKPIAIIYNDVHLKGGNESAIIRAVEYMIMQAVSRDIRVLIMAGDLFDSRSFQRMSWLQTFDLILGMCHDAGLTTVVFPGNHDKTLYNSYDSFLDVYRFHPGVVFFRDTGYMTIEDVDFTFIPFMEDDQLIPNIEKAKGSDILVSHFEMAGSTNLGRVSESSLNAKMLKKWKKTYLGHYHNTHEITKDIVHLPSFLQNNFGEDDQKGFSVIYDDLSYEVVIGKFTRYNKVVIDLNSSSQKEIDELVKTHENSEDVVRFELIGDEEKLKAFDRKPFKNSNIDIKLKYDKVFDRDVEMPNAEDMGAKVYDQTEIRESFKSFCKEKGFNHELGSELLEEFLKK